MKKQELIHYHGLLVQLHNYLEETNETSIEIPEYDTLGATPVAIHVGKGQHEDAVFALSEGLADYSSTEAEIANARPLGPVPADD